MSSALTPLQNRTLLALRRSEEPLIFDTEFVDELTADFARAVDEMAERVDEDVFLSKRRIAGALGCEEQYLLADDFAWNPRIAGGQIAHRAIQLAVHWSADPIPTTLVDEAIERLMNEPGNPGLSDWLIDLSPADHADLRHFASEKVANFQECFPTLEPQYYVRTESLVKWRRGPVTLSGKADLTLGRPRGTESTKLIIDLKTGRPSPQHSQDLRFYALLETLKTGVPPRKLATFYLDSGEPAAEAVTEGVLEAASRRTLDGLNAHIALTVEGRDPVRRAGPHCNWCPLLPDCEPGQEYITARVEDD